jgi:RNA polymerase-binding transcription factor DksA
MTIDLDHFEKKLLNEKTRLEGELAKVGRVNPDNPSNWEAIPAEHDASSADENVVADAIEEYEDNNAIVNTLLKRYKDIKSGLDKLKHGQYGKCQVCGEEIEAERLEVNPAARTCKKHM